MSEELNAEKSLCWQCKFGLCLQETEQERMYHPNIHGMLDGPPPPQDPFNMEMGNEEEGSDIIEHIVSVNRVRAICYWKEQPIPVANIKKCNRFEQQSS